MGASFTPSYRVEYSDWRLPDGRVLRQTPSGWDIKQCGRPTAANLEKHMHVLLRSFQAPNGVNQHVSKAYGVEIHIPAARIIHQKSGAVVSEWKAPMFFVL